MTIEFDNAVQENNKEIIIFAGYVMNSLENNEFRKYAETKKMISLMIFKNNLYYGLVLKSESRI